MGEQLPQAEGLRTEAPATQEGGYAFVMNVSRLVDAPRYELAPDHQLRRATQEEQAEIRKTLQDMSRPPGRPLIWENRVREDGHVVPMAEQDWRYYVISFRGSNITLSELEQACCLTPKELDIGFTVFSFVAGGGLAWHPERLFRATEDAQWRNYGFVDLTASDIKVITKCHTLFRQQTGALPDINRLVGQLLGLRSLSQSSPLQFLGYFAILEALLVHLPNPSDPYDSITRQLKKKLVLLSHRWDFPIDYGPFGPTPMETIWSKMYTYRSQLAHGGNPAFTSELSALGSHNNALNLLKETVKTTIRQALIEPELLLDLRDC
jgi:hypothetical protein